MASVFQFFGCETQKLNTPQQMFVYLLLLLKHLNKPLYQKIMVEFNIIANKHIEDIDDRHTFLLFI